MPFTIDAQFLITRIANLLQRTELDSEILFWLNFVQRELMHKVKFPESRIGVETTAVAMGAPPVADPEAAYFYDLPADFDRVDHVYFKDTTSASNVWGINLEPLPREFYAGDTVDLERLLRTSSPSTGTPRTYWINGLQLGIYPALATGYTGKVQLWYYRVPPDMTLTTDVPLLDNKYRHYLIWLTVNWAKAMMEQGVDAVPLIVMWERKFDKIVKLIQSLADMREHPSQKWALPDVGTEDADEVYD